MKLNGSLKGLFLPDRNPFCSPAAQPVLGSVRWSFSLHVLHALHRTATVASLAAAAGHGGGGAGPVLLGRMEGLGCELLGPAVARERYSQLL